MAMREVGKLTMRSRRLQVRGKDKHSLRWQDRTTILFSPSSLSLRRYVLGTPWRCMAAFECWYSSSPRVRNTDSSSHSSWHPYDTVILL
jgi:hypothetical protein